MKSFFGFLLITLISFTKVLAQGEYIAPPVLLTAAEYYIDTDPGYGLATPITVNTQDAQVSIEDIEIDISNLSSGFHRIVVRFRDADEQWGIPRILMFYVPKERAVALIDKAEYFYNDIIDAGTGQSIDIPSSSDGTVNIDALEINTPETPGFYRLFVRFGDSDGDWGIPRILMFYVPKERAVALIDKAEYFYNDIIDAGTGQSIDIPSSSDGTVNIDALEINTPETPGFYRLYVRFGDSDGDWGIPQLARFFMPKERQPQQVTALEYFVNTKTALGEGTSVELDPSASFTQEIDVTTEETGSGFARIYVRAKDEQGQWGTYFSQLAYIPKSRNDSSKITGLEYFIDTKTGFGEGKQVELEASNSVNQEIDIPISDLNEGFSKVYIRLKDEKGNWGNYTSQLTYVNSARVNKKKITDMEYFLSGTSRPVEGQGAKLTAISVSGSFDSVSVKGKALVTLTQGLGEHAVYVRAKDEDNQWGIPYSTPVSITNQRLIQGILRNSGQPQENTIVSLYKDNVWTKTDTTEDFGLFTFAGLESGNYEVRYASAELTQGRTIDPIGSSGTISLGSGTNLLGEKNVDVIAPLHVIAVTPAKYDVRIRLNSPIELSFNAKFNNSSLTSEDFSLISDIRGAMPISISKQSNDSVVTLTSSRTFLPGEKITLYLGSNYTSLDSRPVLPYTTHFRASVSNGGTTFGDPVDMLIPRDQNYPPQSASFLTADMDNDGDVDLLHYSTHQYTDTLLVYYNNGSGVYSDVQKRKLITESKNNFEAQYFQSYIFTGDYDRDGDIDVGVYHYDQSTTSVNSGYTRYRVQIYVYKNNGTGSLSYDGKYETDRFGFVEGTKFLYDSYSGKPKIMIPSARFDEYVLLLSVLGSNEFSVENAPLSNQTNITDFNSADVTGDGLLDLLPTSYNYRFETIYVGDQSNSNAPFSLSRMYERVQSLTQYIYDDFSRSNKIEKFALTTSSKAYFYQDKAVDTYFNTLTAISLPGFGAVKGFTIGDLTNNGRIELALARSNRIDYFGFDPVSSSMAHLGEIAQFGTGTHTNPHLADLDKDGDLDLTYVTFYDNQYRIHVRINSSVSSNNNPTVANNIVDKDIRLTDPVITEDLSSVFNDQDGDPLIITVLSSKPSVATAELDGSNVLITPKAIGNTTVTLSADDNKGGVVSTEFIVYVNAPDNYTPRLANPIADIETRVGDDSTVVVLTTVFSDPDAGDVLTYSVENPNTSVATTQINGINLIIKPVAVGTVTIKVTANDGKATAEDDVVVSVLPRENRSPVLSTAIPNLSLNKGDAVAEIDPLLYFSDPDSDELSFSISSENPAIASGSYNTTTKRLLITAAGAGSTLMTVTARDPGNREVQTSFTVFVNAKPRAIASLPTIYLIVGGSPAIFTLNNLFEDENGDNLTFEVESGNGSIVGLSVNASGSNSLVSFSPIAEGETTATLKARDANSESEVMTVTVNVKLEDFTSLSSNEGDSFFASGIPVRSWTLFSVPGTGVNASPKDLFGSATNQDFRIFTLNNNGEYSDQTDEAGSVLGPGDAAWFKTLGVQDAFTLQTPAGKRIRERSRKITVNQWRFISNPYEVDAYWSVNDSNAKLWKYSSNSSSWVVVAASERLKPWSGYLAYSPGSAQYTITPDGFSPILLKQEEAPVEEVIVSLHASVQVGNQTLLISNRSDAKEEFDKNDEPLLPSVPDEKQRPAYIKHETVALSVDARPLRSTPKELVEDYRTIIVPNGHEFITWNPIIAESSDVHMAVINEDTYRILAPGDTLKLFQNGKTREFKLYFGSKEEIETHVLPESPLLFENYPNPFNPTTTIRFALNKPGNVNLTVYDILGRKVATLVNAPKQQGYHTVQLNGLTFSSGIYLYRLTVDNQMIAVKKMTLIK